jgi:hypothetical protein
VIDREAILVEHRDIIIVEVMIVEEYLFQGEPGLIDVGEEEPCACLAVDVDHKVEDQLEYLEGMLDTL